ncbi:MAG TPA: ankyrin repeat domain-containing protein [Gemmatimonadaceae bacterium]
MPGDLPARASLEHLTLEALAAAVRGDDLARAAELLVRHPALRARLDEPIPGDAFGTPAIVALARAERGEMIDLLLRHGASIDARSRWWAGSFGALDLCPPRFAPFLIERGATVTAHAAARLGMLDRLEALVAADPSLVHARGGDGQMPLHCAATVEIARWLLDRGAHIDALDVDHESTPAQYMMGDRRDVARFLVERGCRTDILMAAALGDIDRVRAHLDADPSSVRTRVSARDFPMRDPRAGGTIYQWTLGRHKTAHVIARDLARGDIYDLLMERSPDELRLSEACRAGDDDTVRAVLDRNPALAAALPDEASAELVAAAETNDTAAARRLLAAGWPPDARGERGETALHHAAWYGNLELVRELLRRGAPVDAVENQYGGTPLDWARHGETQCWRREEGDYAGVLKALRGEG